MKKPIFNLTKTPDKGTRWDGWSNSATQLFHLYVTNDTGVMDECFKLRDKKEEMNKFLQTAPIKIDRWAEGRVWLEEIVVNLIADFTENYGTSN